MGLYFIAAGILGDNRLMTLDTARGVSDFEPFLLPADIERLTRHFPSGEGVFLWGATTASFPQLEKVSEDEFVVDFKNREVAHIFRFAFWVDTGMTRDSRTSLGGTKVRSRLGSAGSTATSTS